ncbi:MAG: dTDP-4-dehydrorhamnose reductase, partial [candidate division Zixibacteria bacterium]|nr:dTDP-4-dehydrorhamnose reductase [candidate division Zixibacteria bacterium]
MAVPRFLITGCRGQLGRDLHGLLKKDFDVTGVDLDNFDIRNAEAVAACVEDIRPDVILHAAAYTDVDGSESHRQEAESVNVTGTENIALAARKAGARVIYYSTDYVFDGLKETAYVESDEPYPLNVYGTSKLEGEKKIGHLLDDFAIMRIGWLYGRTGKNFVKTMIGLGKDQMRRKSGGGSVSPLRVVDDQVGNPTWTVDVAAQTRVVIEKGLTGLYHATAEGETSWYRFALDIFEALQWPVAVEACSGRDLGRPAQRPGRSSLENQRLK